MLALQAGRKGEDNPLPKNAEGELRCLILTCIFSGENAVGARSVWVMAEF